MRPRILSFLMLSTEARSLASGTVGDYAEGVEGYLAFKSGQPARTRADLIGSLLYLI